MLVSVSSPVIRSAAVIQKPARLSPHFQADTPKAMAPFDRDFEKLFAAITAEKPQLNRPEVKAHVRQVIRGMFHSYVAPSSKADQIFGDYMPGPLKAIYKNGKNLVGQLTHSEKKNQEKLDQLSFWQGEGIRPVPGDDWNTGEPINKLTLVFNGTIAGTMFLDEQAAHEKMVKPFQDRVLNDPKLIKTLKLNPYCRSVRRTLLLQGEAFVFSPPSLKDMQKWVLNDWLTWSFNGLYSSLRIPLTEAEEGNNPVILMGRTPEGRYTFSWSCHEPQGTQFDGYDPVDVMADYLVRNRGVDAELSKGLTQVALELLYQGDIQLAGHLVRLAAPCGDGRAQLKLLFPVGGNTHRVFNDPTWDWSESEFKSNPKA